MGRGGGGGEYEANNFVDLKRTSPFWHSIQDFISLEEMFFLFCVCGWFGLAAWQGGSRQITPPPLDKHIPALNRWSLGLGRRHLARRCSPTGALRRFECTGGRQVVFSFSLKNSPGHPPHPHPSPQGRHCPLTPSHTPSHARIAGAAPRHVERGGLQGLDRAAARTKEAEGAAALCQAQGVAAEAAWLRQGWHRGVWDACLRRLHCPDWGGGGGWHKALVLVCWRCLLASRYCVWVLSPEDPPSRCVGPPFLFLYAGGGGKCDSHFFAFSAFFFAFSGQVP